MIGVGRGFLRAMFGDETDPKTIVGYLVDEDGHTVGGPTASRGQSFNGRGEVLIDMAVTARRPMGGGTLRIYGSMGPIMDVPVDISVGVGDSVSPPPIGMSGLTP